MTRFSTIALVSAASLMAAGPVVAQAAPSQIERSSAEAEGEKLRGGYLLPLAVIIAVILGVLLISGGDEDPVSK